MYVSYACIMYAPSLHTFVFIVCSNLAERITIMHGSAEVTIGTPM
jgi:hypothetical protein